MPMGDSVWLSIALVAVSCRCRSGEVGTFGVLTDLADRIQLLGD